MKTIGTILLILLAKGAALQIMRDSVREQQNQRAYERMMEGQQRRNQARQQWQRRVQVQREQSQAGRRHAARTRSRSTR